MALIGKIRKNSWILITMVALGMGGFIVMDMVSAGSRSSGNQFLLGEVNGEDIDWNDFQRAERILYPNSTGETYAQRNYLWNYMIEDKILKQEAEESGFGVGNDELQDLQFGTRISPVIQRNFRDPNTGQLDRNALEQIKANLGTGKLQPQLEEFWNFQLEEIKKDRLQSKLTNLVKKSLYTPTWLATQMQQEQGSSIDFLYVKVPYDKIADSEVKLTDDDYKNWAKENEGLTKRKEEFRTVDFVEFKVIPTAEDTAAIREKFVTRVDGFRTAENDSLYVANNLGIWDEAYVKKADFAPSLADTIFDLPTGTVYGPYLEGGSYQAVKVLGKRVIPDSVESRHILVRAETPEAAASGLRLLDSLKTVIEAGAGRFDSLAMRFSQDGSAQQGGDLGYSAEGRMVKPFNDLIFYQAEPKELHTVITQFGVHLVEVTNRKFINNESGIKVAFLNEPIVPSEATQDAVYDQALEFVGQNRTIEQFKAAVEKNPELKIEEAPGLTQNGYQFSTIGSGGTSRDIIRWAFAKETEVGQVAPEAYVISEPTLFYNSSYVVPALRAIIKPGSTSLQDIKDNFTAQVTLDKKGAMLAEKLKGKDLYAAASEFGVEVDTFEKVNFNMSYLQNLGSEPKLIGKVTQLKQGEATTPVIGTGGVYLAQVINRTEASLSTDISSFRRQVATMSRTAADTRFVEALRDAAKVKDNRFNFF